MLQEALKTHDTLISQAVRSLAQGRTLLTNPCIAWHIKRWYAHVLPAEATYVDGVLSIRLKLQTQQEEPLLVATEFQDDMAAVTLIMTPQYVERLAGPTSEGTIELFLKSIGEVLMDMVLDPPEEIVALFDPDAHGEAIHRFLMRPSTQSRSVSPRSSRASSRAV